jgi:predicted DNA-binding transcriptional regulator YafY
MPKTSKVDQRYRRIHDIFSRRRGSNTNGVKLIDLAEELDISLRQLSKDIKYMQDHGAPLEYVPALRAWRYKEGEDFVILEGQFLNGKELSILRIALETLNRINIHDKALGDLPEVFRKIYTASRNWTQPDSYKKTIYFDPPPQYDGSKHLTFFLKAIEESRRVVFGYRAFHAEQAKTVVFDPWFLRHYDHRWYVGGYSHDPSEQFVRVFPLERIEGVPENIGYCHDKPRDYNAETYWRHIYGISVPKDGKIETVLLEFTSLQGRYFLTSPFFEPFNMQESSSDHVVIQMNIIVNTELVRKLASFGDGVRVLQPASLATTMQRFFENAAQHQSLKP